MRHLMPRLTPCLVLGLSFLGTTVSAAETSPALFPTPKAVKWSAAPPVLPKGAEIAVLSGDPTKADPFIIRLKLPANYAVPAHHHPTAENVTVVAGTLFAGMGDKLDRSASTAFVTGGFAAMPAQMNHFAWTKAPAIIQIEANGPFEITYANPADDPSKTH